MCAPSIPARLLHGVRPMSKSNSTTAILDSPAIDLKVLSADDDIVKSIVGVPDPVEPSEEVVPDTEEAVLQRVENFDGAFGRDPLKDDYRQFAEKSLEVADPKNLGPEAIDIGRMGTDLCAKEHNLAPSSYKRSDTIKKLEHCLRVFGVPDTVIRPQVVIATYWLAKLYYSGIPEEGKPRSLHSGPIPADFCAGNLRYSALRSLTKLLSRVSRDDEGEMWDFKEGEEALARDLIDRMRAGTIVVRQMEALIEHHRGLAKAERERAKLAGLTASEAAAVKAAEANVSRNKRLEDLGRKAVTLQKEAADELKMGGGDLADFLVNKQVIPSRVISIDEWAQRMTKGDAKALVQALLVRYQSDPSRGEVFMTLYGTTKAVVEKIQAASQENARTRAKVG